MKIKNIKILLINSKSLNNNHISYSLPNIINIFNSIYKPINIFDFINNYFRNNNKYLINGKIYIINNNTIYLKKFQPNSMVQSKKVFYNDNIIILKLERNKLKMFYVFNTKNQNVIKIKGKFLKKFILHIPLIFLLNH